MDLVYVITLLYVDPCVALEKNTTAIRKVAVYLAHAVHNQKWL